jgi:gamma-glutamyltranspeptidase
MTALARLRENAAVSGPNVISAGHPLAAAAGATNFARGGNAFDAALAACFMERGREPQVIVSPDFGLHQVAADSRTDATALAVY